MPMIAMTRVAKGSGGQLVWEVSVQWAQGRRITRWGDRVSVALGKLTHEIAAVEREEDARMRLGEGVE